MIDATRTADIEATTAPDAATVPGTDTPVVPGYDLLEEVGRGGMGVVYRARDAALARDVAVKILQQRYAAESGTARRFVDEACITGQLQHPGIPAVYQVGALADGRPFLAMKLIKGDTLEVLLKSDAPMDALAVFGAVSQAVGYAHAHDVIHRDLKPANVMLGAFGEVQVMDWGLAKVLAGGERPSPGGDATEADPDATEAPTAIKSARDSDGSYTQAGSVLGTPAYMPPEQAAGELGKVDARSDVFGLGAILCVLLTGKPPFAGKDSESVRLNAVRGKTEEAFARLDASGADPDVIALCKRCLAFEPADRPATANEVATAVAALRRAADDRARQAERDKLAAEVQTAEGRKRRRVLLWAGGSLLAMLLIGVASTTVGLVRADTARQDAEAAERATEAKRIEAEAARLAEAEQRRKAEAARRSAVANESAALATVQFFENKVFAAARPKGQQGGLGKDVTLREAIAASLPALGTEFPDQPMVEARLRMTLGTTFGLLGDLAESVAQQRAAWAIYQQLDPDDPRRLTAGMNLASAEQRLGRNAEAIRLAEDVLARQRRVYGPDSESVFISINNLANYYTGARRHAEALALREQVLERHRAKYPPTHEKTLLAMYNLSRSLYALNRHPEALELREQVLAARRADLPPNHPSTLLAMNRLAKSFYAVGRRAEALALREQTAAGQTAVLPADHQDTLETLSDLASSYTAAKRHPEALVLYGRVYTGRTAKFGPDAPTTLSGAVQFAQALARAGRSAEAIPVADAALGQRPSSDIANRLCTVRIRHFERLKDAAGCRATAVLWEKLHDGSGGDMYDCACHRAVAAGLATPAEATADADRAMAWLAKAIAAGYKDRAHMDQDTDLAFLRDRADFQKLMGTLPEPAPMPRRVGP